MPRIRFDVVRRFGLTPGWPGRVVLPAGPALVVVLDPSDPPPPIEGATALIVAADRPVPLRHAPAAPRIPLHDLRATLRERGVVPRAVVIHSIESARFTPIWEACRSGARRFHFTHSVGASLATPPLAALALGAWGSVAAALRRIERASGRSLRIGGWQLVPAVPSRRAVRRTLAEAARVVPGERDPRAAADDARARRSIVHYIGNLGAGGAERQLTYLALAEARLGHAVTVLTSMPLAGAASHHAPELVAGGVRVRELHDLGARLPSFAPRRVLPAHAARDWPAPLRAALDAHPARRVVLPLVAALEQEAPAVLHCWLDEPNAVGAVAGLLARVPRVVLSTRNVNPRHFPVLHRTWFRASYRLAAHAPTVRLIANSHAGAADYAAWCGVDARRFHVVHNGVEVAAGVRAAASDPAWRARKRAEAGLPADAFVIGGVFRLAPEKRPLDFLEVLARTRVTIPGLRAFHVGAGPEEAAVHERARSLGLGDCLVFVGRRANPIEWLALADVSLLTSAVEGCPNVVLESQALGVPAVLTRAAGAPEAVLDGVTGRVCDPGDLDGLAACLAELAARPALLRDMGEQARAFVTERFSIERMVERTMRIYA
ncbi:MAG: glycosyltransferase [bacterium]